MCGNLNRACGNLNRACGNLNRLCGTLKRAVWYFEEGMLVNTLDFRNFAIFDF